MIIGITAGTFDLFHCGHVLMLAEAKKHCDYLIVAIQTDPSIDRPLQKNTPVQSIVERQIQVKACTYVDDIIVYTTENDLKDILLSIDLDVRILGEEYKDVNFTGKDICEKRNIKIVYNRRDHNFSSSTLRKRVVDSEIIKYDSEDEVNTFRLL